MTMSQLGMRVSLQQRDALEEIKAALETGNGISGAAEVLEVSRPTLYRWGAGWPAVGRLLRKYSLGSVEAGSRGGRKKTKRK